jgi:hypothetical protein
MGPWLVLAAAAVLLGSAAGDAARTGPALGAHGIGGVRFGLARAEAVAELRVLFGAPTSRGVNTGCGPSYGEVEWHDLVAEFRRGRFTGYRYLLGGWPLTTPGSPRQVVLTGVAPRLATGAGVTLGTTLADARHDYGALRNAGVDLWRTADGLLLSANESSPPRIAEVRVGTCGDF